MQHFKNYNYNFIRILSEWFYRCHLLFVMWFHRDSNTRQRSYLCGLIFPVIYNRFHTLTSHALFCENINQKIETRKAFWKTPRKLIIAIGGFFVIAVTGSILFVTYEVHTLHRRFKLTDSVHHLERRNASINLRNQQLFHFDDSLTKDFKQTVNEKFKRVFIPWAQSKTKDPTLLLRLVESEDANTRRLGLIGLLSDNGWKDYQYRTVAQGCSFRTLVSLARVPDSNDRFFPLMPWLPGTTEPIVSALQSLLVALQKDVINSGIKQYTAKILIGGQPKNIVQTGQWNFEDSLTQEGNQNVDETSEKSVITNLLHALVSHTCEDGQRISIVNSSGLLLLHRIYIQYRDDTIICQLIAWILANLSLDVNLHQAITEGGWVTVLHHWFCSCDTALSFHATRALANLDRDIDSGFDIPAIYDEGVYLAHPAGKTLTKRNKVKADIVFIHGLRGGPFKTWRQKDGDPKQSDEDQTTRTYFWPKDWLARDVPNVRIINVGYQTKITTWDMMQPIEPGKRSIVSRSEDLLAKLRKADIGSRPVILVGHSMGGLLIKEMMRIAAADSRYSSIVKNTIGILFYSVPHHGSSLAKMGKQAKYMVFPSAEVQDLVKDNEGLRELHNSFLDLQKTYTIPVRSFGETEKTHVTMNMKVLFVPPDSSDPGCGDFYKVPTDHINVCKPTDTGSELYQLSLFFIWKCLFMNTKKQTTARVKQTFNIDSEF